MKHKICRYFGYILSVVLIIGLVMIGRVVIKHLSVSYRLDKTKVEIYEVYHKNTRIHSGGALVPIHAGRALHTAQGKKIIDRMIGDDTGDNISFMNSRYSELTALYWIWKNSTADYVGLMHYRRRFIVADRREDAECDYNYGCYIGVDKYNILSSLYGYDVLVPYGQNLEGYNIYDHYGKHHYIADFDAVLQYIRQQYPEMNDFIDDWLKNNTYYPYNMFIMKKELLDEYAAFLFDVLFAVDKQMNFDHTSYDPQVKKSPNSYWYQRRAPGFISERLFDLWIKYNNYRVKEIRIEYGTEYFPLKWMDEE